MKSFLTFIIFFLITDICLADFSLWASESIGKKCSFGDCSAFSEQCKDGYCRCNDDALEYYENGVLKCKVEATFICRESSCDEDKKCDKNDHCVCKDPTKVLSDGRCVDVTWKSVREECKGAESLSFASPKRAQLCNLRDHLVCKNGRCACFSDMFAKNNETTCISKSAYLNHHKIDAYKAMVGDYCSDENDCIRGLDCTADMKCSCPRGCQYREEFLSCDCGTVTFSTPVGPIVAGLILGFVSCLFWGFLIRRNVRKLKQKRGGDDYDNCSMDEMAEDHNGVPSHDPPPAYPGAGVPTGPMNSPYPVGPQPASPYPMNQNPGAPYPGAQPPPNPYPGTQPPANPYPGTQPVSPYPGTQPASPYPMNQNPTAPNLENTPYPTNPNPPSPYPPNSDNNTPGFVIPGGEQPYPVAPNSQSPYPK